MDTIFIKIIAHIVAFIILIVFSWKYFNESQYFFEDDKAEDIKTQKKRSYVMPVYPKYMIPSSIYFLWYLIFFLFLVFLYLLIFYAISFNEDAVKAIKNVMDSDILSSLYMTYPSLLAALLIAGLLPGLPKNFDLLNLFRNFTHSRAAIPNLALSYYNNIIENRLIITEEDQNATVNFVGKEFLNDTDFKQRENSLERNWAITCYLYYKIRSWTEKPNTTYSKNRSKKPIAYDNFVENFESFKREYKEFLPHRGQFYTEYLENHTKQILNQIVQITVCLIFCSESNDEQARSKFKELGVNVDLFIEYKIRFELLFILLISIFCLVFIFSFGIDYFLQVSDATSEKITGPWARNAAIISTLIFGLPIIAVLAIKSSFKMKWPARDQFSSRKNNMFTLSFFIGIGIGIISFFLINKFFLPGVFDGDIPWQYSILSGLTGGIAAYCIDRKPKEWKLLNYILPAFSCGLIMSALFGLVTCGIIAVTKDFTAHDLHLMFEEKEYKFMIIFSSILGFIISFFISLLCDFTTKIRDKNELLILNLRKYFLPHINAEQLKNQDSLKVEINRIIKNEKHKLPKEYCRYLEENNLISSEGDVNENFCIKIYKLKHF